MLRGIAVLVLLLGILPAAVQALPRGSGPDAPAAVRPAQGWLLRLGSFLDGLWKRARAPRTATSGTIGSRATTPSTCGVCASSSSGRALPPSARIRRIEIGRDYQELKRLNRIPEEHISYEDLRRATTVARRVYTYVESYEVANDSFFSAAACAFLCQKLNRSQILQELHEEPWFVKHEVLARWGWLRAHQELASTGVSLEKPFSLRVAARGRRERGTDREFYQLIHFLYGLRHYTGEELLLLAKGETPDFDLETTAGTLVGVEMTEAPVSREWAAERDAEEEVLAAIWDVLRQRHIHIHVFELNSWQVLEERLPDFSVWLQERLQNYEGSPRALQLTSEDFVFTAEVSPWPYPAITVSDQRGLTGEDIAVGTLQLEESIALAILGKLEKPNGRPRKLPRIRPCQLVIYPNHDFGQDLEDAVERFSARSRIDVSSHFDSVWLSDERSIARLI